MYSEYILNRVAATMKKERLEFKEKENAKKEILPCSDIASSLDFIFSQKHNIERVGDSGELLFGYTKGNKKDKYIIKHYHTDCACNEYMYSKLSNHIGVSVPKVKLIKLDKNEKRKYFHTEYIAGIEYINIIKEINAGEIGYDYINSHDILNREDFYKFWALYNLFSDGDSFEVVVDDKGIIYKIDNTSAFVMS